MLDLNVHNERRWEQRRQCKGSFTEPETPNMLRRSALADKEYSTLGASMWEESTCADYLMIVAASRSQVK